MLYINFNLKSELTGFETTEQLDKLYQTVYRPLIKFLNTHQKISFSLHFSGNHLLFLKKRRKEFITLSRQLIDRKQLEIIGGGFYDPVLPLIYPIDRNAQIELLNSELRSTFGKRPRGICLNCDTWDPCLVNTLQACDIEYVFLESSLIPDEKLKFVPIIMSDLGKTVEIIPYYPEFIPTQNTNPADFVALIQKRIEKANKIKKLNQLNPDYLLSINLNQYQVNELLESNWLETFSKYIEANPESNIDFILPNIYRKNNQTKIPAYIPSGINDVANNFLRIANNAPGKKEIYSVYDFLDAYPLSKNLYNRILYISMLVNQYKVDKMRKNAAKEKLWQAENGTGLLFFSNYAGFNSQYRQKSYKLLMEAEKILRQDNNFTESINNFDYNSDGLNEYVCRMQNYFSYITLVSGAIQELEILKNTGNYADNLSRIEAFDGIDDNYERGIFVDHVLTEDQFNKYVHNETCGDGIFSKIQYKEIKLNSKNHELQLCARAIFTPTKQQIYLRKKYIINSAGMYVQYIIRNESNKPLNVVFAIESNFAHTNFNPENVTYYNLETVENEKVKIFDTSKSSLEQKAKDELLNIDTIRLTDAESGISFCFEPNENCGYFYEPLFFKRPDTDGTLKNANLTFVSTLFWNINLDPGCETERTINFSITAVKKQKTISNE